MKGGKKFLFRRLADLHITVESAITAYAVRHFHLPAMEAFGEGR
jgi:hypothetical protein